MKIKTLFDINQGHQITDEEIYHAIGDIPVITGQNEIKGYWNKKIIEAKDLPCLSYPTKANSGVCFVQDSIFDANNTAVLVPTEEWRSEINLNWFASRLSCEFPKIATSKEGVNYLNREIVEELEILLPSYDTQTEQNQPIAEALKLKANVLKIIDKIQEIKAAFLVVDYTSYQGKQVLATKLFQPISGNSGLTEAYLYHFSLSEENKKYEVLTGSVDIENVDRIHQCPHPKDESKKIRVFSGEGIHVVRKGKAGFVNYLPFGDYTLNDDAYIITKREKCSYELSLKWFVVQYSKLFLDYASHSDNGTWSKSNFFKHATFDIPSINGQKEILKRFETLEKYERILKSLVKEIDNILNKEVVDDSTAGRTPKSSKQMPLSVF
jgi:hypothetical protein